MNFGGLTPYAWRLWKDRTATELVHSLVIESCPLHEAVRCIHVGLLCVQDHPDDKPLLSSDTFMLEIGSALLPAPNQPAYVALRNSGTQEGRENAGNSLNAVSITTLDVRCWKPQPAYFYVVVAYTAVWRLVLLQGGKIASISRLHESHPTVSGWVIEAAGERTKPIG